MLGKVRSQDLFDEVLIHPFLEETSLNRLCILSGYASAAMAFRHRLSLTEQSSRPLKTQLIYGMSGVDGVSKPNHGGFLSLKHKREFSYPGSFECYYMPKTRAIHSKLYIWCQDERPVYAFIGSANYTENGFSTRNSRSEVLAPCEACSALAQFEDAARMAFSCDSPQALQTLSPFHFVSAKPNKIEGCISIETNKNSPFIGYPKVTLSLLTNNGTTGAGSNLNWGIRPNGTKRNPNQAYIGVRGEVRKSTFFPPRGQPFTVLTDDGEIFTCSRAQDGDKAIHTPHDNAEFGRYFRKRLGLPSGAYITPDDLKQYGRTDVTFYKLDDENYILDFSARPNHS